MHVTLQDVAELAGVSTKTVSRVGNNQGEISEATRQRVQAAIEQLLNPFEIEGFEVLQ